MKPALVVFVAAATTAVAAPPPVMNHQGRIAVDNVNFHGTGQFKFALVDAAGTTTYWSNDATPSGEPASPVAVAVDHGHYAVALGDTAQPNMTPIDAGIFANNDDVRLRLWFATTPAGPFELLAPDRRITTTGYAFTAATLQPGYQSGDLATASSHTLDPTGQITLDLTFPQAFAAAPNVGLAPGWTTTSTTRTGFTAQAALITQTIDAQGVTGSHTSTAIIAGHPAVAYYDTSRGDLKFIRATDPAGTGWPAPVTVDGSLADVGQFTSLAEVDGHPAISYYDATHGDLKFARAADPSGTSWPAANLITVTGATTNAGWDTSLAVVAGLPTIAFHTPGDNALNLAIAADTTGTVWPPADINPVATGGRHASLISLANTPAIAHYDPLATALRFTATTTVTIDATPDVGQFASLAIVGGHPSVSYLDASNGDLLFARATDPTGTTWAAPVPVDASPATYVGQHASLTTLGGNPAIAYLDATSGSLNLTTATTPAGTTWNTPAVIDPAAGPHISITLAGGLPLIAYHDPANFDLKIATTPDPAWTSTLGDPLPVVASAVKPGAITETQLAPTIGVWEKHGAGIRYTAGRVGIGRSAATNSLEVAGTASKSTAGSWLSNSDRRIKTDITTLTNPLQTIDRLRPVAFRYTDQYRAAHPEIPDTTYYNVIAQEFAQVFPDSVQPSGQLHPDGTPVLQVDTYPATIHAIAAIQQLNAQLKTKDQQINDLQNRLQALEQHILFTK